MGLRLLCPQGTSSRVMFLDPDQNDDLIRDNLESLEEHRDNVSIRIADYKQKMKRFYDRSVKARVVLIGDLVLCRADVNLRDREKFSPNLRKWPKSRKQGLFIFRDLIGHLFLEHGILITEKRTLFRLRISCV